MSVARRHDHNPAHARRVRLSLGIGCAFLLQGVAFADAVVNPATEPFMTLAPYILEDTNLEPRVGHEDGGTTAYRPWFENGAWTGDLIEYLITKDGVRQIRDDIGRYPRDGEDWRGTQELWSARYAFPDYEPYDQAEELDPDWVCTEEDPEFWKTRSVFTVDAGEEVPFLWNELSAAQRLAVDPETAADVTLDDELYASPILNYVRGDRTNERCKALGDYRWRFSILGAIVNSTPVHVPTDADGVVLVGANDGMLHGFDATDGAELFGYLPSMLLDRIGLLRISPYQPTHFVDGELRYRDVGTSEEPQHIVAGGLGAGGKGLFILDVTDPDAPKVIREIAGTSVAHLGGTYDAKIGHIHGRATISRLKDADADSGYRWYVVTGNGYGSETDTAQLMLIPVDGGAIEYIATDATITGNGLSAPSLVDVTGNGQANFAYAGDIQGNLWRFDLNERTVTKLFAAGAGKPITVEPDIGRHPDGVEGYMVYFGTGSLLSADDIQNTSEQSVFGIWDTGDGTTVAADRLITQTLVSATAIWSIPEEDNLCGTPEAETSETTTRLISSDEKPVWVGDDPTLGWQVNLPGVGERLIGHPQIRAQRIQFVTTNPYDMIDATRREIPGSGSWILQLDLASGGNPAKPLPYFDLNKNCALDPADGLPEETETDGETMAQGAYPVGVALGAYHIAQPAFARVRFSEQQKSVVDGVYINALQLPLRDPEIEPAHGPLDVTTDSPAGPAHWNVEPEPAREPFGTRQFPQASGPTKPFVRQDGLGHRVDGHSYGYNHHHGVNYVDFFDLEPRRDDWRLDIASVYKDGDAYKRMSPMISERELNRVTEVGIGAEQRFIAVISNADLSQSNTIQIGCKTWPVYEYQTLMMNALRKPTVDMIADLEAAGLIFTLSGTYNPIRPSSGSLVCSGTSLTRTLRITPTDRIGALDATMATLPGCVTNTNTYKGPSGVNAHLTLKAALNLDGTFAAGKGPVDLYATDPHATPNREGAGYRWRNGALTVQLLAINDDNTPAFTLQLTAQLPRKPTGIEGQDRGWGGAYARAFTVAAGKVVPLNSDPPTVGTVTSGLLYELSLFWHWGDMTRFSQEGVGNPVTAFCYGASGNHAPSLMYETDWFTPGAYQKLTEGFTEAMQLEYISLLEKLKSADRAVVEAALLDLSAMFDANPNLLTYHRLRSYVPNSKQLNEEHLIMIDRGGMTDAAVDGTPADVIDIERDLLPSLGPNYQLGRRSWIDLTPQ